MGDLAGLDITNNHKGEADDGPVDMVRRREVVVKLTKEGFHYWANATGVRSYLANLHRHLFYVVVGVRVEGDDREIEFHDLRDHIHELFPGGDMGPKSCEMMAADIVNGLKYYACGREVWAEVWEDNEVGARVQNY